MKLSTTCLGLALSLIVCSGVFAADTTINSHSSALDPTPAVYIIAQCTDPHTKVDSNCIRRYQAYEVINAGDPVTAKSILCENPFIQEAFANAGNPCTIINDPVETNWKITLISILFLAVCGLLGYSWNKSNINKK